MCFARSFLFLMTVHQAFAGPGQSKTQPSLEERVLTLAGSIGHQKEADRMLITLKPTGAPKTLCHRPFMSSLDAMFDDLSLEGNADPSLADASTQVKTTQQFPWSTQCALTISFKNLQVMGSGTLIAPRLVLTAAHNLYNTITKEAASSVQVIPGYKEGLCPFGLLSVEAFFYPDDYVTKHTENYALLVLKENMLEKTGHMGLWRAPADFLHNRDFFVTGCVAQDDKGGRSCSLDTVSSKLSSEGGTLFYDAKTSFGQSGAGVYCREGKEFFVVGVHVGKTQGKTQDKSFGTLLTTERLDMIHAWVQEYNKQILMKTESNLSSLETLNLNFVRNVMSAVWDGCFVLMEAGCFDNLSCLMLVGNNIDTITMLSRLKNLRKLCLDRNRITQLDPLAALTRLERLELNENGLVSIDALSGLTSLWRLDLKENHIMSGEALKNLRALKVLDVAKNALVRIDWVAGLQHLDYLDLSHNAITDFGPVVCLKNLKEIKLDGYGQDQLSPLKKARPALFP